MQYRIDVLARDRLESGRDGAARLLDAVGSGDVSDESRPMSNRPTTTRRRLRVRIAGIRIAVIGGSRVAGIMGRQASWRCTRQPLKSRPRECDASFARWPRHRTRRSSRLRRRIDRARRHDLSRRLRRRMGRPVHEPCRTHPGSARSSRSARRTRRVDGGAGVGRQADYRHRRDRRRLERRVHVRSGVGGRRLRAADP